MSHPRIGFVSCVHPFYDVASVAQMRQRAIAALRQPGVEVLAPEIPRDSHDAVEIARQFREKEVDLAILFFCTWVAEDITLALARELMDVPMLLWSLPYLDRDIPMPSPISGLVTSGSNIRRLGKRYVYHVGDVTPGNVETAMRAAKAGGLVRALRKARFGIAGYPCPGMVDVSVNEADIQRALGATTVHLDLDALVRAAEAVPAEETAQAAERVRCAAAGGMEISEERLCESLRLYPALKETVRRNKLDAYCVRCWPELRDQRKITPCAAHALMAGEGVPNTCEVDLTALISTWMLSRLAGAPAFNFDITGYLEDEQAIQLAHCGAAAPSLAERPEEIRIRSHMRTGTGATFEFPFKRGEVTLAKLMRPVDGELKLFAARGDVVAADGVRGSVAHVKPEPSAAAFLERVMRLGVEHHFALAYGDWMRELEMIGEFTGIEVA